MKLKYSVWSVNSILKQAQWKFLQQSICDFMQIHSFSILESNTYSWSGMQVSRAASNVQEYSTHTSRRTLGAIFNAQAMCNRNIAARWPSCQLSQKASRETKRHQLEPSQVCPSLSPNTLPIGKQSLARSFWLPPTPAALKFSAWLLIQCFLGNYQIYHQITAEAQWDLTYNAHL